MNEWKTKFRVPIYEVHCWIILTDDITASKKKNLPQTLLEADIGDDKCQALFMAHWPHYAILTRSSDAATLCHEIGHVARKIMEDIGFKIRAANDEPLAYLEEYLTRVIHKKIPKNLFDKPRK